MKCKCTQCGIEFEKEKKDALRFKNVFCSRSCSTTHNNLHRKRKPTAIKCCGQCGKEYIGDRLYCSKTCATQVSINKYSKNPKPINETEVVKTVNFEKVKTECAWCHGEHYRTEYQIAMKRNRFCSDDCEEQNRESKNQPAGTVWLTKTKKEIELNEGFKHNRYAIIRHSAKFEYKKHIDKNECFNCGYDKHIQVAHIKAIKDFDESATVAEINSPDNLVGLCPNCHWEFDHGLLSIK